MLLGPVFHAELVTTSRRRRYYAARLAYGLTLLLLVGWTYEAASRDWASMSHPGVPGFAFLAVMASHIFATFLLAQVGAVLCLTPAMVAGTIADERQRKTLHDLLASRLSSFEIVVGKLAARMLQLVVLVLTGLPIMAMLSLFGGLDPPLILAAFAGTLTTAFAVAGLAIFVSSQMRRARDAILVTYLLELICLGAMPPAPGVLRPDVGRGHALARSGRPGPRTARPVPARLPREPDARPRRSRSSGWRLPGRLRARVRRPGRLAAPAGLGGPRSGPRRPSRGRRPTAGRSKSPGRIARVFGRPPVGDDPMAWKERHVARLGPVLRSIGLPGDGLLGRLPRRIPARPRPARLRRAGEVRLRRRPGRRRPQGTQRAQRHDRAGRRRGRDGLDRRPRRHDRGGHPLRARGRHLDQPARHASERRRDPPRQGPRRPPSLASPRPRWRCSSGRSASSPARSTRSATR